MTPSTPSTDAQIARQTWLRMKEGARICRHAGAISLLLTSACFAGNAFTTGYLREGQEDQVADGTDLRTLVTPAIAGAPRTDHWARFFFPENQEGAGDAAAGPFGDQVEYKINAVNYNLHVADELFIPFQLYFADIDSSESPEDVNEAKLLDPTQGVAIQFPVAWLYRPGGNSRVCGFEELKGYCIAGGDVTVRGVQLNEQNDAGDIDESFIFGASVGLRAAAMFPIFEDRKVPGGEQSGHLSAAVGARYYYHNTDKQQLLFGEMTAPDGTPIEFDQEFAALSVESEFDIYEHFKIRLEYFYPLSNRDALDEVFKASLVLATK